MLAPTLVLSLVLKLEGLHSSFIPTAFFGFPVWGPHESPFRNPSSRSFADAAMAGRWSAPAELGRLESVVAVPRIDGGFRKKGLQFVL